MTAYENDNIMDSIQEFIGTQVFYIEFFKDDKPKLLIPTGQHLTVRRAGNIPALFYFEEKLFEAPSENAVLDIELKKLGKLLLIA